MRCIPIYAVLFTYVELRRFENIWLILINDDSPVEVDGIYIGSTIRVDDSAKIIVRQVFLILDDVQNGFLK